MHSTIFNVPEVVEYSIVMGMFRSQMLNVSVNHVDNGLPLVYSFVEQKHSLCLFLCLFYYFL